MNEVRDALITAKESIQKYGWVQGHLGGTNSGFCVVGAVHHAASIHRVDDRVLRKAVGGNLHRPSPIELWNDAPWRRKSTVLRLFDRAIKALTAPEADRRVSPPKRWRVRTYTLDNLNLTAENRARYQRDLLYVPDAWATTTDTLVGTAR